MDLQEYVVKTKAVEHRIAETLSEKSASFSHQLASRVAIRVLPGIGWIVPSVAPLPWLRASLTAVAHSIKYDPKIQDAANQAADSIERKVAQDTRRFQNQLNAVRNPTAYTCAKATTDTIRSAIACAANGPTSDLYIKDRASEVTRKHALNALKFAAEAFVSKRRSYPLLGLEEKTYKTAVHDAVDTASENFDPTIWLELWPNGTIPDEIELGWKHLLDYFHEQRPRFDYWRDWYQGFLEGEPLDWELQRRVALIPDADWDKGPEHIAQKIEEIKAAFLAEKIPLAETVEINADTGLFRVVPIPVQNPPLIGTLLSRVADSLDDALQGNNGLNDRSREVRVLTRTIDRYGNDPQRIEMDFTSVAVGLRRQIDSEELPPSEDNLGLLDAVEEGVRGIRAAHPDVAANRALLAQQAFRELLPEEKAQLTEALPILQAISEGMLVEDFGEDIGTLINDAILPPGDFGPRLPGADAAARTFGRASKMALIWNGAMKTGAALHDSPEHKTARLVVTGTAAGGFLLYLVQLGLKLLGVL